MTTPGKNPRRTRTPRQPRRAVRTFLAVTVLAALLIPAGYLFTKLWTSTGDGTRAVSTERSGVGYARPLTRLLGALLDAQAVAVAGNSVDDAAIRTAVDDVNAVDRQSGDPLGLRQRWGQLSHEIDAVLGSKPVNGQAVTGYAASIGLAQALLGRIGDAIKVSPDAGTGGFHLVETSLEFLPDVTVNAGQLAALAHVVEVPATASGRNGKPAATIDPRLTVAQDRVSRAANSVNVGLRAGGDPASAFPVDLNMLGPLDEFSAAIDALAQTANALGVPNSGAKDALDAATDRVQKAALTLESAVLSAFDNELSARAGGYAGQRRNLAIAGLVIALAAAVLLWLRVPAPAPATAEAPDQPAAPARYPGDRPAPAPAPASEPIPDVMDARDLLAPELVHVGRAVRARKRRDADDPR
jgi:hypothetical protein